MQQCPYGLYAAFAVLSLVFVIAFIKETKGKKLEEEMDGERAARPEHS